MDTVFVVLDTNTFLHYVSLEQIDWNELFPGKKVVLFICPPVIRELNKHKDAPRTAKLRDRAATALRRIDCWADAAPPITLRDQVELRFTIHEPGIDFAAHNLVRHIEDDHLIAVLIQLQTEASPTPVVLLTRDTGLKLKARTQGVSVSALPDSALLPDEALPSEKRIKELETQVRELQNARPKLRLAFSGGGSNFNLKFHRSELLSESDITDRVAELTNKHPKMDDTPRAAPNSDATRSSLYELFNAASSLAAVDPQSVKRYNEDLDSFFTESEEYLRKLADFRSWESRTAAISLILVNDGSSPADDVDIFLHFPDGFELFEEDDYEKEPEAPKAPRKPRSIFEETTAGFSMPGLLSRNYFAPDLSGMARMPIGPSNVSAPKIKRTNSYDVKVHVGRAKHGIEVALDVLYITFDPESGPRSFAIDYAIHASNLPKRVSGTLNVIV